MAYVDPDFKTKTQLKEAIKRGDTVRAFQPGPFPLLDGVISVEGPHYPRPHTWYARVEVRDSIVRKVVS